MFSKSIVCWLLLFSSSLCAEVTAMLGINVTYDFAVGLTLKVISDDQQDEYMVAIGTSYYPFAKDEIGLDFGIGRTTGLNLVFLYGIDIYRDSSYMSLGFIKGPAR